MSHSRRLYRLSKKPLSRELASSPCGLLALPTPGPAAALLPWSPSGLWVSMATVGARPGGRQPERGRGAARWGPMVASPCSPLWPPCSHPHAAPPLPGGDSDTSVIYRVFVVCQTKGRTGAANKFHGEVAVRAETIHKLLNKHNVLGEVTGDSKRKM